MSQRIVRSARDCCAESGKRAYALLARTLAVAIMTNFKLFDCHQQIAFRIGLTVQTAGNEW